MSQHKIMWSVGLSNGENAYEEKGEFCTITGELSPWQRLVKYMGENGLTITSLSLYTNDGRRWNIPSAGKNPKFKAFCDAPQPIGYKFFRKFGQDQTGPNAGKEDHFSCIEAQYENGMRLQVWVDEATGNSWSMIA